MGRLGVRLGTYDLGNFSGGPEKIVQVEVNGVEADFHMNLDNSGEAYFVREVDDGSKDLDNLEGGGVCSNHYSSFNDGVGEFSGQDNDMEDAHLNIRAEKLRRVESDAAAYVFYEFSDEHSSVEGSPKISEYSPNRYDTLDSVEHALESQESNSEVKVIGLLIACLISIELETHVRQTVCLSNTIKHPTKEMQSIYKVVLITTQLRWRYLYVETCFMLEWDRLQQTTSLMQASGEFIIKNQNLIFRIQGKYLPWRKAAHVVLGIAAFDLELPVNSNDVIPVDIGMTDVEDDENGMPLTPSCRWRLWPIPFRKVKTLEHTSSMSSDEAYLDSEAVSPSHSTSTSSGYPGTESPRKQIIRTNVPNTDQIESLNLKEGQNMVNFVFSTRVLGPQKVEAHIYLWKWNTRIIISDVDGTITKSDVLGQFMPLVGKDWTHSGIAHLFSAINDGKSLPTGPVVISPDGLFPSLYREVIRRAPHEFKIACLEDIKALFPPDYNPFYAGFGNRDTDELSYRKIGIPKGKIFIINPKGEVAINHCIDLKSYTSLNTLVKDMFPPASMVEQEDYNSWNYWKMSLFDLDNM
ncbi:hypothetical protein SASPL_108522 [Salvia splendens]|uniref:phosphatidate phosphatase n=1 Tax=Salvia splendens TaxID=180675 RepID=A0A8X9A8B3_SALSN|nr:hypothetical protein SASPL_108522 [Salvia splendens]